MLGSRNLIAFAAITDFDKARDFYVDVLGLDLVSENPFALEFSANGTMLRLTKFDALTPQPFTILGWNVPDINQAVADLRAKGVDMVTYEGMGQDDLSIWTAPDGVKVAWFKDPNGNTLSVTEFA